MRWALLDLAFDLEVLGVEEDLQVSLTYWRNSHDALYSCSGGRSTQPSSK